MHVAQDGSFLDDQESSISHKMIHVDGQGVNRLQSTEFTSNGIWGSGCCDYCHEFTVFYYFI